MALAGVLVALGLLLAGCGPGTVAADRPSAEAPESLAPPADEPITSAPATGEESLPPDQGGGGGATVDLPRLPVGGSGAFTDGQAQDLQCASMSWNAFEGPASLDRGVDVVITGFEVDARLFVVSRHGCEALGPSCVDFVLSSSEFHSCIVAVHAVGRLLPGAEAVPMWVRGRARCSDVSADVCADFVSAVASAGSGEILLQPAIDAEPPTATPSPSDSTSPPESTSPGESPSATDTATADASPTA